MFFYYGFNFKKKPLRKIIRALLILLVLAVFCTNNIENFNRLKVFTLNSKVLFQKWAKFNLKPSTLIYKSPFVYLPIDNITKNINHINMRYFGGRARNQLKYAKENNNKYLENLMIKEVEREKILINGSYATKALSRVNPDYVIISSAHYNRFLDVKRGYPKVKGFFEKLINEKLNYKILKMFHSEYPCPFYGKEKIIVFFRDKKL